MLYKRQMVFKKRNDKPRRVFIVHLLEMLAFEVTSILSPLEARDKLKLIKPKSQIIFVAEDEDGTIAGKFRAGKKRKDGLRKLEDLEGKPVLGFSEITANHAKMISLLPRYHSQSRSSRRSAEASAAILTGIKNS